MPTKPWDQSNITPAPPHPQSGDAVRQKLMEQGLCEEDVAAAIAWGRDHKDDKL